MLVTWPGHHCRQPVSNRLTTALRHLILICDHRRKQEAQVIDVKKLIQKTLNMLKSDKIKNACKLWIKTSIIRPSFAVWSHAFCYFNTHQKATDWNLEVGLFVDFVCTVTVKFTDIAVGLGSVNIVLNLPGLNIKETGLFQLRFVPQCFFLNRNVGKIQNVKTHF